MVKACAEMGYRVPETIIAGEVVEADSPQRLVLIRRMLMDPNRSLEALPV